VSAPNCRSAPRCGALTNDDWLGVSGAGDEVGAASEDGAARGADAGAGGGSSGALAVARAAVVDGRFDVEGSIEMAHGESTTGAVEGFRFIASSVARGRAVDVGLDHCERRLDLADRLGRLSPISLDSAK
jgi:hypothetical protein